ncbi:MAG: hypothetical protein N2688_14495, partial [Burkholderiaceae bacterium]|nr:hypothetical protein [Burkholderiaceae bacterium]
AETISGLARSDAVGRKAEAVLRFVQEGGGAVELARLWREARLQCDDWCWETAAGRTVPVDVTWVRGAAATASGFGGVLTLREASARRDESRRLAWQARHDSLI